MGVTAILAASAVASVSGRMAAVAIPWLILITTGDPVSVGLVSAAEMLPYVLSSVFSAPLQDRMGSRRTSILADLTSAGTVAVIAGAHQLGFGVLVTMVALGGCLRAAGDRGRTTVLRPLIDQAGVGYPRVTSAYEGIRRTSVLVGVSIGGVALALLGAEGTLWFTAGMFVFSAAIVAVIVPDSRAGTQAAKGARTEGYWASLRSGMGFFRRDRLLPNITGMLLVTNLFNQASAVIFVPLWVLTVLHSPLALGLVAGAFAAGSIVGNIAFTVIAPYVRRYPALVAGYLIGGMPRFVVLALSDDLAVVSTALFLSGFAMCSVNPTIGAVIYQRVPAGMLARTNGIIAGAAYAALPLGGLAGSLLVTRLGYSNGVLVAALVYFIASLSPVIRPWIWREIDDVRMRVPEPDGVTRLPLGVALIRGTKALRVTLTYQDGHWVVRARRRLRTVMPETVIEADRAVQGLSQLDSPPVRAALTGALAGRADQLRRSLNGHAVPVPVAGPELLLVDLPVLGQRESVHNVH